MSRFGASHGFRRPLTVVIAKTAHVNIFKFE